MNLKVKVHSVTQTKYLRVRGNKGREILEEVDVSFVDRLNVYNDKFLAVKVFGEELLESHDWYLEPYYAIT